MRATAEGSPLQPNVVVRSPGKLRKYDAALKRAASVTLSAVAPRVRGELTIILSGDALLRRLNRRFRGIDAATDVLAFPIDDGREHGTPFGDVVISADAAARQ